MLNVEIYKEHTIPGIHSHPLVSCTAKSSERMQARKYWKADRFLKESWPDFVFLSGRDAHC